MIRNEIEPNGNLSSFLMACSKMCTLKHQLINSEDNSKFDILKKKLPDFVDKSEIKNLI
jgi:hypothetical protein